MLTSPLRRRRSAAVASRRPTQAQGYRRTWRDRVARYRRPAAACLAALAVAAALAAVSPERAPTVDVLVTTRDLAAGAALSAADVERRPVSRLALPPGHELTLQDAVGQQVAVGLAAGTPLHAGLFVGEHLLAGAPDGTVAVPLQPSNTEVLGLLSPGLHVDVILSEGNGYEQPVESEAIAHALAVLWVPRGEPSTWVNASAQTGKNTVVLAATGEDAAELASASSRGEVHLVLVNPGPAG